MKDIYTIQNMIDDVNAKLDENMALGKTGREVLSVHQVTDIIKKELSKHDIDIGWKDIRVDGVNISVSGLFYLKVSKKKIDNVTRGWRDAMYSMCASKVSFDRGIFIEDMGVAVGLDTDLVELWSVIKASRKASADETVDEFAKIILATGMSFVDFARMTYTFDRMNSNMRGAIQDKLACLEEK